MGIFSFISYLDLRRPLVFLCGPAYSTSKTDRRYILQRYINSKWKLIDDDKNYVNAFPIIVDGIFVPNKIREENNSIKINILEEIVANISYRTYIFLDTLSTSYELGQFTNLAYRRNSVSIFVDKLYKERINNSIGDYISASFEDEFIEYDASYNNKGYIYFPIHRKKPKIPEQIIKILEKDNPINKPENSKIKIVFTNDVNCINDDGNIIYRKERNTLIFDFSIKNLFYYVSAVYRDYKNRLSLNEMPKSINDPSFLLFIDAIKKELLGSFLAMSHEKSNRSYILCKDFDLKISASNLKIDELIYHILYISNVFAKLNGKYTYIVPQIRPIGSGVSFFTNELKALGIYDKNVAIMSSKYSHCDGTISKTLVIKKKKRKIISYSNNHCGRELRHFHSMILSNFLWTLPSSNSSFAYKKDCNTLKCVKAHEGNWIFAKFDIHKYFESIKLFKTKQKIGKYVESAFFKHLNKINYYSSKSEMYDYLSQVLKPLFSNYRLPIGFVASPKISDFYLYDFDEEMRKCEGVIYTRYADDILLSSNDKLALSNAVEKMLMLLTKEQLTINESKTRLSFLKNTNDSFKFLGINIVRRDNDVTEYTIGNKYLVETSKMICSYASKPRNKRNKDDILKIAGRINYIKDISGKSYSKLMNMVSLKLEEAHIGLPFELMHFVKK